MLSSTLLILLLLANGPRPAEPIAPVVGATFAWFFGAGAGPTTVTTITAGLAGLAGYIWSSSADSQERQRGVEEISRNIKNYKSRHSHSATADDQANNDNDAQAPGMPDEDEGYVPPKNWDGEKVKHPKTGQHGYPDRRGRIWVPTGPGPKAHGGPHWDVVNKDGKNYDNVYPGGKVRKGKRK